MTPGAIRHLFDHRLSLGDSAASEEKMAPAHPREVLLDEFGDRSERDVKVRFDADDDPLTMENLAAGE